MKLVDFDALTQDLVDETVEALRKRARYRLRGVATDSIDHQLASLRNRAARRITAPATKLGTGQGANSAFERFLKRAGYRRGEGALVAKAWSVAMQARSIEALARAEQPAEQAAS